MGKIVIGIIVAVASFMLADALICNKCNYGFGSFCLISSEETCSTNTSVCGKASTTFPSITSSFGFTSQGCREPTGCNSTSNGTLALIGVGYQVKVECCSTDKCSPVASGAPSTKTTFTAATVAAILASVMGSRL